VHLDILGTLLIFIAGFGWAKPVMVNRSYFKKPRLMGILVSIAGPLSNLLIGFLGIVIVYILVKFHMLTGLSQGSIDAIVVFLKLLIHLNLLLFVFNLIPLPPLDGYRILQDVLPHDLRMKAAKYEQWAVYIFLLMVFIPPLSAVTIGPILQLTNVLQNSFYQLLLTLFGPAA
ncbi:MAG: zinc metalloprotease, partial [Paenibacillus sp. RIFOXYA1_FULL_44_5]